MRVILEPDLFRVPRANLLLTTFFHYALDDRHHIEADLEHPEVAAWLREQSIGVHEEVMRAVDGSIKAEALEPSQTVVQIGVFPESDFTASPIELTLADARAFLETPFSLIFEDAISDRHFLLKMLTEEERRMLQRKMDSKFVLPDHGGGLGGIERKMGEVLRNPKSRHTTWILFDSDAMQPGRPSEQSERLRIACAGIPHYQLRRRHMESYLTPEALHVWASRGRDRRERTKRFGLLSAYRRMQPHQRHHFNMKKGFAQDAERPEAAGNLYDGVPDEDKVTMQQGFGSNVGGLFQDAAVTEADLRRDSGWSELRPIVRRLMALMR